MLVWNPSLLLLLLLFFILSSDTREKVCSCVFKNSPRFFFFVFPFLFLLLFAGHQKKLLNSHGLNISGSGPEENSHSTAPMNDCSKNVHFFSMRWKDMQILKCNYFGSSWEECCKKLSTDTSPTTAKNAHLCQLVMGIWNVQYLIRRWTRFLRRNLNDCS